MPQRTPDGQNAGLASPLPVLLVTIASGTLELPGVRRRSAGWWPWIAWCRSTPSSLRASRPEFSGQIGPSVGVAVRGRWLRTARARVHPSRDRDGSIRDGRAPCRCCLRVSRLMVCVFASMAIAGGFRRSGRLRELLRRKDGSSEGVAWTAVLNGSSGLANAVILYIFAHTRLLGPRKARPPRASPPRPRARKSRSSRTTLAHAHAKGATTGEKGVQDDCGEGHKALSGQASTAGHGLERSGVLVRTPLGAHCCTSESPTRDSCAPSARSATPRSLPT